MAFLNNRITSVTLVYEGNLILESRKLRDELAQRHIECRMATVNDVHSANTAISRNSKIILFISDRTEELSTILTTFSTLRKRHDVLIIRIGNSRTVKDIEYVDIIDFDVDGYDIIFEKILSFILGPLPSGVSLVCRPSQMRSIAGVAAWNHEIVAADDYYGHLLVVSGSSTSVIMIGLDEPYHLHLDRRELSIAHVGANEVLFGDFFNGVFSGIQSISFANEMSLKRPHCIMHANNYTVIADTDNQRILWTHGAPRQNADWRAVQASRDLLFPCAAAPSLEGLWIADTFHDSVFLVPFDGISGNVHSASFEGDETPLRISIPSPIALALHRDWLLLVSANDRAITAIRRKESNSHHSQLGKINDLLGMPIGLSINEYGDLYIGDRMYGCIWVIRHFINSFLSENHA